VDRYFAHTTAWRTLKRHPWVGCQPTGSAGKLNGAADRVLAFAEKVFKCSHQTGAPGIAKVGSNPLF
jgi:hypothetical protein